jgi:hypothetical protein
LKVRVKIILFASIYATSQENLTIPKPKGKSLKNNKCEKKGENNKVNFEIMLILIFLLTPMRQGMFPHWPNEHFGGLCGMSKIIYNRPSFCPFQLIGAKELRSL